MPDFSLRGGRSRIAALGADAAASDGVLVDPGGVAHVKGSYAQISASTPFAASGVRIHMTPTFVDVTTLTDFAVGAAASEVIIMPDIHLSTRRSQGCEFYVPLAIPEGVRLSARCQGSSQNDDLEVTVDIIGGIFENASPMQRMTAYGVDTSDSGGVSVDPGGSANTKGSYSQIIAATTSAHRGLLMAIGSQDNHIRLNATFLIDVAVGAAASEQIVIPDFFVFSSQDNDCFIPNFAYFDLGIPDGTRLAVRAQSDITDATDRLFDVVLYGLE
jgi:hypothetical protein